MTYNFNWGIEIEGFLKLTGSHVSGQSGTISALYNIVTLSLQTVA